MFRLLKLGGIAWAAYKWYQSRGGRGMSGTTRTGSVPGAFPRFRR